MAPQSDLPSPLRSITTRIALTDTRDLPSITPHLASTLSRCSDLLSLPESRSTKNGSENAVLVHKFRTRLSTLLQDKSVEGRWAAVVLIKATIEAGGWEILHNSNAWVRLLIGILGKQDPVSTKKICIITLTRIFLLTYPYQTLVREITTPSLPLFIRSCLDLILVKGPAGSYHLKDGSHMALVEDVLAAFCSLLPQHPTLFRSFAMQIQQAIIPLVAPTPSTPLNEIPAGSYLAPNQVSQNAKTQAQELFVMLHYCATKNATSSEWESALVSVIDSANATATRVFRAVVERFNHRFANQDNDVDVVVRSPEDDPLQLPAWSGIYAGTERLTGLLELLAMFIISQTSSQVTLPLTAILELTGRVTSVQPPSESRECAINQGISADEREGLWSQLPSIHVTAFKIYDALLQRLDNAAVSLYQIILEDIEYVFEAEHSDRGIRTGTYSLVKSVLDRWGQSFSSEQVESLNGIILSCCEDLVPEEATTIPVQLKQAANDDKASKQPQISLNADDFIATPEKQCDSQELRYHGLIYAAGSLLPSFIATIPTALVSDAVRGKIDQTTILCGNKAAMKACILYPPQNAKSSILPYVARACRGDVDMEAFLRPRMPFIRARTGSDTVFEEEMLEEEGHSKAGMDEMPLEERELSTSTISSGDGTREFIDDEHTEPNSSGQTTNVVPPPLPAIPTKPLSTPKRTFETVDNLLERDSVADQSSVSSSKRRRIDETKTEPEIKDGWAVQNDASVDSDSDSDIELPKLEVDMDVLMKNDSDDE